MPHVAGLVLGPGQQSLEFLLRPIPEAYAKLVGHIRPFRDVAQEKLGTGLLELRVRLGALARALYVLSGDVADLLAKLRRHTHEGVRRENLHALGEIQGQLRGPWQCGKSLRDAGWCCTDVLLVG